MRVTVDVEDVGGSFERFLKQAPKQARAALGAAVKVSAAHVRDRMEARAPVGPDAPHIKDAITVQGGGRSYRVGIFDNDEEAHHALYNEYSPNHQPFMRPALEDEAQPFVRRITDAMRSLEAAFGR